MSQRLALKTGSREESVGRTLLSSTGNVLRPASPLVGSGVDEQKMREIPLIMLRITDQLSAVERMLAAAEQVLTPFCSGQVPEEKQPLEKAELVQTPLGTDLNQILIRLVNVEKGFSKLLDRVQY